MPSRFVLAAVAAGATLTMNVASGNAAPLDLREGERIVFLGNTFAERMQHFGYFEALLQRRFAGRDIVVRNLGWSGDEVGLMPRPLNFEGGAGDLYANDTRVGYDVPKSTAVDFKMLRAHLSAQAPDTIFLCFGANESFKGEEGLDSFAKDYQTLIDELLSEHFNGRSAPRLILVSPIPQETLGAPFSDPVERNARLRLYSECVGGIAAQNKLIFADIFPATEALMNASCDEPLTIDGLQLNTAGQKAVAALLAASLGITGRWFDRLEPMRQLVVEKNRQFFFRWRPINGEYVFGRRKEPFGVITFPPEMEQWDRIVGELDARIHEEARRVGSPE